MAQFTGYIEEEYLHPLVALLDEHPGHRQGIASIVARTSNDHKPLPWQEPAYQFATHHGGSSLHKVDRTDILRLACSMIYGLDCLGIQYLHINMLFGEGRKSE